MCAQAIGCADSVVSPAQRIHTALQTGIIDVIRLELPTLGVLDRQPAYEAVMNNPDLVHAGFLLFRAKPDLFASVVRDEYGQPVTQNSARLACGRTLARRFPRASPRLWGRARKSCGRCASRWIWHACSRARTPP